MLSYQVDIEPEQIQSYANDLGHGHGTGHNFLKTLSILDDITITPSIFIFHDINSIYFIFQEVENDKLHRNTLKSILKTSSGRSTRSNNEQIDKEISNNLGSQNTTKKVRIVYENSVFNNPDSKKIRAKLRKTRRRLD